MTDFETPLMRDIGKLITQVFFGLLIGGGLLLFFMFPFSATVYGPHCMITTTYTIPQYIWEQLTVSC